MKETDASLLRKINHHSIHIAKMDTQQIWRGIASPYRSSEGRLKQVWTLLTVAVLELGGPCAWAMIGGYDPISLGHSPTLDHSIDHWVLCT